MARYVWSGFEETQLTTKTVEAETLLHMGLTYSTGREVEVDLVAAHKWFNLAALKGSQRARTCRMEIASELSRQDLRSAQRQAREWLRKH